MLDVALSTGPCKEHVDRHHRGNSEVKCAVRAAFAGASDGASGGGDAVLWYQASVRLEL
jgi:hypothetical protein